MGNVLLVSCHIFQVVGIMTKVFDPHAPRASKDKRTKKEHPWRAAQFSDGGGNELEQAKLLELILEHNGNVSLISQALTRQGYKMPESTLRQRLKRADVQETLREAREHAIERIYDKLDELATGLVTTNPMTGEEIVLPPDRQAIMEILKALDPERWDSRVRALKWEKTNKSGAEEEARRVVFEIVDKVGAKDESDT